MGTFDHDDKDGWREREGDEEESWKKAHESWKNESRISDDVPATRETSPFWSEERWEKFIQETDKDGLQVIKYYERYWNHQDRDVMVENAMALHYVREAFKHIHPENHKSFYVHYFLEPECALMNLPVQSSGHFLEAKLRTVSDILSYRLARDFARFAYRWLKNLPDELRMEKVSESFTSNILNVCTKLSGAHVMGYQPWTMGGQIVLTKRALRSVNRCMEILFTVKDQWALDYDEYLQLDEIGLETRNAIALRLQDLREKFKTSF